MESFELITLPSKTRLPFEGKEGQVQDWQDEVSHRLNEHPILNRDGVIHQSQGQGARKFAFRILNREPGASERYRTIERTLGAEPFCKLIHPRYSQLSVVFVSLKATEDRDGSTNAQLLELVLSETGLREVAQETAGRASREASQTSLALKTQTAADARLAAPATALDAAVIDFATALESEVTTYQLQSALKRVGDTADAFVSLAGVEVRRARLVASARLTYGLCLRAYGLSSSPVALPILMPPLAGPISLRRFVRSIYGGGALAVEQEILRMNRIASPHLMPPGLRLLVPDPERVVL